MRVLALQTVGEFVGLRLAHYVRASIQESSRHRRRTCRGPMRAQPVGAAEAGPVPGDVVDVLHAEGETGERTPPRAAHGDVRVPAECIQRIAFEYAGHAVTNSRPNGPGVSSGCRQSRRCS